MTSSISPPDPVALIQTLDPEAIARRLAELDAEQRALRVLLRTARARQQGEQRREARGVSHGR